VKSLSFCKRNFRTVFVSGSFDRTIKAWDIEIATPVDTFTGHEDIVTSVVATENCDTFISGSADRTIRIWDFYYARILRIIETNHTGWITSVAVTDDN